MSNIEPVDKCTIDEWNILRTWPSEVKLSSHEKMHHP